MFYTKLSGIGSNTSLNPYAGNITYGSVRVMGKLFTINILKGVSSLHSRQRIMISVAMATYNGEKYIKHQIESILINLSDEDEVIISDDGSTDGTVGIINGFNDLRIKLYEGPKEGLVRNFANSIMHCRGDIIFLCDQDDVWYSDKVHSVCKVFQSNPECVLVEHDARIVGVDRVLHNSFFEYRRVRTGFLKNIMRNTYHGCLMAFRKELIHDMMPFPTSGCLHDQWIGLTAEKKGRIILLDKVLMDYKRHESNASSFKRFPINKQIKDRMSLIYFLAKRGRR